MASRKRKSLPPWLQGVTVKKKDNFMQKIDPPKPSTSTNKNAEGDDIQVTDPAKAMQNDVVVPVDKETKASDLPKPDTEDKRTDQAEAIDKAGPKETASTIGYVEAFGLSYEEYKFKGSIVYSYVDDNTNVICDELIKELEEKKINVIGFDTEWPVTYEKGGPAKTALVQVCASEDKCYLFHISCMPKFPIMLRKLIENNSIKKVGLNIEGDIWKIGNDYDFSVKSVVQNGIVELKTLANETLRSLENWSLEGLAKNVLRIRISKDPSVRKCNWSQFPLPQTQRVYAATDAVISLKIYNKLTDMKTKKRS